VSIGLPVMSIELVLGATAPAGVAQAPGENEVQAAAPDKQVAEPQRDAEQRTTEQPQDVAVAREEKAPEQSVQPETAQAEPMPAVAMVESPKPEIATATPQEIPPDTYGNFPAAAAGGKAPRAEGREETGRKAACARHRCRMPRRRKNGAASMRRRKIAPPSRRRRPRLPMRRTMLGRRSDSDSNYAGLVSAHLRRHQQYPAGRALAAANRAPRRVASGLDGGGRVTSARPCARLGRRQHRCRSAGNGAARIAVSGAAFRDAAVSFAVPVTFR
jgi:hypothetical protein